MESLESPHDGAAIWLIHCLTCSTGEDSHLCGVAWYGDLADDICAKVTLLKDGLDGHTEFDLILVRVLLHHRDNLEWQVDVL